MSWLLYFGAGFPRTKVVELIYDLFPTNHHPVGKRSGKQLSDVLSWVCIFVDKINTLCRIELNEESHLTMCSLDKTLLMWFIRHNCCTCEVYFYCTAALNILVVFCYCSGFNFIKRRVDTSAPDCSADGDDDDFFKTKSQTKTGCLESYLSSEIRDASIFNGRSAPLKELALELKTPLLASAACERLFRGLPARQVEQTFL